MAYVKYPAAEARSRIGAEWPGRGVANDVLADAERQVTAMLSGMNDLLAVYPMLGAPDDRSTGSRIGASSREAADADRAAAQTERATTSTELHGLSIAELAQQLNTRKLSPVEVTRAILDRIERHDGTLNTYIVVTADEALRAAKQAEEEIGRGDYRGPLHGVPLAAKDLYDAAGIPTTA